MDFQGKVVLVTGSSSGIGAATALNFAKLQAKVVITGRNEAKLQSVAKTIEGATNTKPLVVKADVTKDAEVKKIIDKIITQFGQLDILINNAGAGENARLEDGVDKLDQLIATNLRSVYLLTQLATEHLKKTKGCVVNISSIAAVKAMPQFLPYCITKAGLDMFTKCIAKDLAQYGIRVNSVNPGPVKTDIQEKLGLSPAEVEDFVNIRVARSPLGKITTVDDVAELIIFLSSEKASSITGSIHFIDSGDLLSG